MYELRAREYERRADTWLPNVGLGVTLRQGAFEGRYDTWLRWCNQKGEVIPTGAERAETAHQRAELLAQKLHELGVDPDRL